jgi:prefoldin subunit 5
LKQIEAAVALFVEQSKQLEKKLDRYSAYVSPLLAQINQLRSDYLSVEEAVERLKKLKSNSIEWPQTKF